MDYDDAIPKEWPPSVLERSGLMAGAACGLFVAGQMGSSIAALTSQGFLVVMMIGDNWIYLGIVLRLWVFMDQVARLQKAVSAEGLIPQNSSVSLAHSSLR
jgi:hypothetical protein